VRAAPPRRVPRDAVVLVDHEVVARLTADPPNRGRDGGAHTSLAPDSDAIDDVVRSEEHTSELQSRENLVCRLLLEKKKKQINEPNCVINKTTEILGIRKSWRHKEKITFQYLQSKS